MNYEWGVTCMLDSLPARLAVQNRTFEGGEMDLLKQLAKNWRAAGDEDTASALEAILADEIQHVRFANEWFRRMAEEDPKVLMAVASAVSFLRRVTAALAPEEGEVNAVGVHLTEFVHTEVMTNTEDRLAAGFSPAEVEGMIGREVAVATGADGGGSHR
jgi:uncharacterized ferritin-like protein (DUF455 family)